MIKLAITRQLQWPTGKPVVEVSLGGIEYTNPDALVPKYEDEFLEFEDPREAVEAAIRICRKWREDGQKDAKLGFGSTGGFTIPFEDCTFEAALKWARQLMRSCDAPNERDSLTQVEGEA